MNALIIKYIKRKSVIIKSFKVSMVLNILCSLMGELCINLMYNKNQTTMTNFSKVLQKSVALFIYKINRTDAKELCFNRTLDDKLIEQAYEKTSGISDANYISARLKMRMIRQERQMQAI